MIFLSDSSTILTRIGLGEAANPSALPFNNSASIDPNMTDEAESLDPDHHSKLGVGTPRK